MKSFSSVSLLFILISSLVLAGALPVFAEAPGVIVVISSDTTWTKAGSPYNLTGPILVDGVTLTIEAGTTVNLNGYEIRVNGTLRAIGTSVDRILFENGTITFTEHSIPWDAQAGTGSILQFVVLDDVEIENSVPVSINENPVSDDNVWTKEESPIEFTGNVVVGEGEILTIEAGVTVEMQSYDLIVNGALRVLGGSSDKVYFSCGTIPVAIRITETSAGWDEQTGFGSIIDNAILEHVSIISNVSVKITNSTLSHTVYVRDSSILAGNTINHMFIDGGSVVVSDNYIRSILDCSGAPHISNNMIDLINCSGGSPVISGNTITKIGYVEHTTKIKKETHYFTVDSATITNNIVNDGIYLSSTGKSIISNNTILGHTYSYTYITGITYFYFWEETATARTSGISVQGNCDILGNTISDCEIGIEGGTLIKGNLLVGNTQGINAYSDAVIQSNTFRSNNKTIASFNRSVLTIKDNLFIDNNEGITTDGNAIIERNSMTNSNISITVCSQSQAIIKNNTFTNNVQAIIIQDNPSTTINYNNFEGCTQNSIFLVNTSNSIDAAYNWWGTVDTQAINLTIHDYKYEFGLGKVNFIPILTEPNPQATSDQIPEFPSWIVLPLFLVATFVAVVVRKRLVC